MHHIRGSAVIFRGGQLLLMRRIKSGEEYFVFPGGKMEDGETPEAATVRELKEEFCIDIKITRLLFTMAGRDKYRDGYYYLVTDFAGEPTLGGEELLCHADHDQYHPAWVTIDEFKTIDFRPAEARQKFIEILESDHA